MNTELKEQILNYPKLFNMKGYLNGRALEKGSSFLTSSLYQDILYYTSFLNVDAKITERLYCIINDINDRQICVSCDSFVNFKRYTTGYRQFCSTKCVYNSSIIKEKRRTTNLDRYGVENPNQSREIRNRTKKTNMEKYGVEHTLQVPEIRDKIKETMIENYGVEYSFQSQKIKDKIKETMLNKYGVEYPTQSSDVREKSKESMLNKYGVEYPSQSSDVRDKIKETMIENYGVENPNQSQEIRNRTKKTNMEKYGVESTAQRNVSLETLNKINNKEWLIEQHINKKKPAVQIANELGDIQSSTVGRYLKKFNIEVQIYNGQSLPEKLLVTYIQDKFNTEIVLNSRHIIKPFEIDIFLPEYKLAIEYNGKYWHNPDKYNDYDHWFNYHQNKIDMCNDQGIRLLLLWETNGNHEKLIDDAINNTINNCLELIYEQLYKGEKKWD